MKTVLFLLCLVPWSIPVLAQEFARERLADSPRHQEWVEIPVSEDRTLHSFVVYPEDERDSPAVIVIHENRGLTDWVRSIADGLAAEGFIAVAPDLLSGFDAEHGRTSDFADPDAARNALYELDPEQITGDLRAVQRYVAELPSSNGRVAVMGFCWGGSQAFRFATDTDELSAALVFYGSPPDDGADLREISAPVFGFYGENDQRINATIAVTVERMEKLGKWYEPEIYDGVGHAFMRRGDDPEGSPAEQQARDVAWARAIRVLSGLR